MVPRAALIGSGAAALVLLGWVITYSATDLRPHLGCAWGPETMFWGYDAAAFKDCFAPVEQVVIDRYVGVLSGADRALAVALTTFVVLWSLSLRSLVGVVAGMGYGIADLAEGVYLIKGLQGDLGVVGIASALTMTKCATLTLALASSILVWRRVRRTI